MKTNYWIPCLLALLLVGIAVAPAAAEADEPEKLHGISQWYVAPLLEVGVDPMPAVQAIVGRRHACLEGGTLLARTEPAQREGIDLLLAKMLREGHAAWNALPERLVSWSIDDGTASEVLEGLAEASSVSVAFQREKVPHTRFRFRANQASTWDAFRVAAREIGYFVLPQATGAVALLSRSHHPRGCTIRASDPRKLRPLPTLMTPTMRIRVPDMPSTQQQAFVKQLLDTSGTAGLITMVRHGHLGSRHIAVGGEPGRVRYLKFKAGTLSAEQPFASYATQRRLRLSKILLDPKPITLHTLAGKVHDATRVPVLVQVPNRAVKLDKHFGSGLQLLENAATKARGRLVFNKSHVLLSPMPLPLPDGEEADAEEEVDEEEVVIEEAVDTSPKGDAPQRVVQIFDIRDLSTDAVAILEEVMGKLGKGDTARLIGSGSTLVVKAPKATQAVILAFLDQKRVKQSEPRLVFFDVKDLTEREPQMVARVKRLVDADAKVELKDGVLIVKAPEKDLALLGRVLDAVRKDDGRSQRSPWTPADMRPGKTLAKLEKVEITLQAQDSPLSRVAERIHKMTGIPVHVGGATAAKRISFEVKEVPVATVLRMAAHASEAIAVFGDDAVQLIPGKGKPRAAFPTRRGVWRVAPPATSHARLEAQQRAQLEAIDRDIEQLRPRLQSFRQRLLDLADYQRDLQKRTSDARNAGDEKQVAELEKKLTATAQSLREVQARHADLHKRLADLTSARKQHAMSSVDAQAELGRVNREKRAVEEKLTELRAKLASVAKQAEEARASADETRAQDLDMQHRELRAAIEVERARRESLYLKASKLLRSARTGLRAKRPSLPAVVATSPTKADREHANVAINTRHTQIEDLERRLAVLATKAKQARTTDARKELDAARAGVKARIAELRSEIEVIRQHPRREVKVEPGKTPAVTFLVPEDMENRAWLARWKKNANALDKQIRDKERALAAYRQLSLAGTSEQAFLEQRIARLTQELAELKAHRATLRSPRHPAATSRAPANGEVLEAVRALGKDVRSLRDEVQSLKTLIENALKK